MLHSPFLSYYFDSAIIEGIPGSQTIVVLVNHWSFFEVACQVMSLMMTNFQ